MALKFFIGIRKKDSTGVSGVSKSNLDPLFVGVECDWVHTYCAWKDLPNSPSTGGVTSTNFFSSIEKIHGHNGDTEIQTIELIKKDKINLNLGIPFRVDNSFVAADVDSKYTFGFQPSCPENKIYIDIVFFINGSKLIIDKTIIPGKPTYIILNSCENGYELISCNINAGRRYLDINV